MQKLFEFLMKLLFKTNDPLPQEPEVEEKSQYNEICLSLLELHNHYRSKNGRSNLQLDDSLIQDSQKWSDNMANKQRMYHDKLSSNKFGFLAENIAYNFGNFNEENIFDMWVNSSGHRRNILGNYTHVGFGVSESNGKYYWCAKFGG